jgi:hypothetical protein
MLHGELLVMICGIQHFAHPVKHGFHLGVEATALQLLTQKIGVIQDPILLTRPVVLHLDGIECTSP